MSESNMLKKKIFLSLVLMLLVPIFANAALRAPVQLSPLQPVPENSAPNVNTNINTPGNAFNTSQEQIQNQIPNENGETPDGSSQANNPTSNLSEIQSNSVFYWALIIVCGICLMIMLVWLFIRYRKVK